VLDGHYHPTSGDYAVYQQRSDANGIADLMVWSLHQDKFHRHSDINVTSRSKDISLRQIAGLKRDALMMSLSGRAHDEPLW